MFNPVVVIRQFTRPDPIHLTSKDFRFLSKGSSLLDIDFRVVDQTKMRRNMMVQSWVE